MAKLFELGFVPDNVEVIAQTDELEQAADLWQPLEDEPPAAVFAPPEIGGQDRVECRRV